MTEEAALLLVDLGALVQEAGVEEARSALCTYLGDRRLRVIPDSERRFRVEALLSVPLDAGPECRDARNPAASRASRFRVARAAFEHLLRQIELPWAA